MITLLNPFKKFREDRMAPRPRPKSVKEICAEVDSTVRPPHRSAVVSPHEKTMLCATSTENMPTLVDLLNQVDQQVRLAEWMLENSYTTQEVQLQLVNVRNIVTYIREELA